VTVAGRLSFFRNARIGEALSIVSGPDNALWFATFNGTIGKLTTSGQVTTFSTKSTGPNSIVPASITAGPDGNLWFVNAIGGIGRITPAGKLTQFTSKAISSPGAIVTGPDGALWFTNVNSSTIGRITTTGAVTTFTAGPQLLAGAGS
jgi:virginiamycin B lyase